MKAVTILLIVLCGGYSTSLAQQSESLPRDSSRTANAPCQVLRYDSDTQVDEFEVRARYVTGDELKPLTSLLGVDDAEIVAYKENAEHELFLVLQVTPTDKARGVLTWVKLEIDNESPLTRGYGPIALPTLFRGQYFLIQKICEANVRRAESDGIGETNSEKPIDYVALLHKQKPQFRLRSMVVK